MIYKPGVRYFLVGKTVRGGHHSDTREAMATTVGFEQAGFSDMVQPSGYFNNYFTTAKLRGHTPSKVTEAVCYFCYNSYANDVTFLH